MKIRTHTLLVLAVAVTAWAAGAAFTEDEKPKQPMSEMEMWQKMQEWAQPGEGHKILDQLSGTWKATGKIITSMGELPLEGTVSHTWILDGRFLETDYEGPFMGQTFVGRGYVGYDNSRKQFQQCWIMSMASSMAVTKGTWDAEAKTLTWVGSTYAPDGHDYKTRETLEFKDADHYVATSYATGPDGKEKKEMVIENVRVKDEDAK